MKFYVLVLTIFTFILASWSTPLVSQDETTEPEVREPKTSTEVAALLPAFMEKLAQDDDWSGVVLWAEGDKILFHNAYGLASRPFSVKSELDTKFGIGSMSKMFTSVAIAMLVESGKLTFDDPIGMYLDESWISSEVAAKVQIKHLLSHTSGLGSYFTDEFYDSSRTKFRSIDDYKPLVSDKLAFEPGTKHEYSNTGFLLLGAIIEKVTGQDYFDFVRREVFEPSQMNNTDNYNMDEPIENLAEGYYLDEEDNNILKNNIFLHTIKGGPAGGAHSTAEDLLKFWNALQTDKYVTAETRKILLSTKENSPKYGYGFDVRTDWGHVGHAGGFPGISACSFHYPDKNTTLIVMSNFGHFSPVLMQVWGWTHGKYSE